MRHFTLELGKSRKFVVIELQGSLMRVVQGNSLGITGRTEKELASELQARTAAERMAGELTARGYVEQVSTPASATPPRPLIVARPAPAPPTRPAPAVPRPVDGLGLDVLAEATNGRSAEAAMLLPRMAAPAAAIEEAAKPRKKATTRKKKKEGASDDGLDKRVIALFVAVGLACVGFVGFLGYDTFLKPPTIVGHWEGSRLEHEKGKFLTHTSYQLILDGARNATMTIEQNTSAGTYTFRGNQLVLTFKDEDGETSQTTYKVALGRSTLELYEPGGDTKLVELIRYHAQSAAIVAQRAKPAEAPKNLGVPPANPDDDAKLVAVEFISKDAAFRLKRPASWEVESGSRPDNTYSWARFTRDSAKVQIYADIAGSLMTGSNQSQHDEGSELAPVHAAHTLYARKAAEDYSGYAESPPTLFKGSALGEGRISTFTASGGLFGGKLQGFRITLLTNDRRISILCEAPGSQFSKYQPTFLALARSLAR